jgi:uncharacterized membrane protein affecting hemolysin expression
MRARCACRDVIGRRHDRTIKRESDDLGKTEFVLDAELTDTEGTVVATTQRTYQVRAIASTDTA